MPTIFKADDIKYILHNNTLRTKKKSLIRLQTIYKADVQMNLKHFCLSCGIRVLKRTESTRNWVFSSGMYPYT